MAFFLSAACWSFSSFGWTAEGTAVAFYVAVFDAFPVFAPHIELVGLDFLGKYAEAFLVEFCLQGKVTGLVVCVPAEMVDVGVAVHDARPDLCAELDLGLSPDDGAQVRLADADDAVGALAGVLLEHHLLLPVHLECGLEAFAVVAAEQGSRQAARKGTTLCPKR